MKKTITLFVALFAILIWLVAQRPMAVMHFAKAEGAKPQNIRVGFDFGNTRKNCQGTESICHIEQIGEKTMGTPAWAEGEGTLYFTRSGHVEMDIYKNSLTAAEDASSPLMLPVLSLEDSLYIDFVLPDAKAAYQGQVAIPPGRYYVIETESRYIIQW